MPKLTGRLLRWALVQSQLRTLFLLLTIIGSMAAISTTEATLRDLANRASDVYRLAPYDLEVAGEQAFDRQQDIAAMAGVSAVERVLRCRIRVNTMSDVAIVLLDDGTLFPVEFKQGRAPENENEIAIPSLMAALERIALGDVVDVTWIPTYADTPPDGAMSKTTSAFVVSGIAEIPHGTASILTEAGLQRIRSSPALASLLLVKTDGTIKPGTIRYKIGELNRTLRISEMDEGDDPMLTVATMLAQTISFIMLAAGVGGFYMLLSLSQRERLHDLGVLRAVGISGGRLTGQLILEGLLLLVVGACLGGLLIFVVVSIFHLGNLSTTLAQNLAPMGMLFALFLAAIVYSAFTIGRRPETKMLRGEW